MKQITFYRKHIYGNEHAYIADIHLAAQVTRLTGEKTLTPRVVELLELFGVTFTEVLPPR